MCFSGMKKILNLWLFIVTCFLSSTNHVLQAGLDKGGGQSIVVYKALAFLTHNRELHGTRRSDQIVPLTYARWASACPASSPAEKTFEENASLDKKSLFVRDIGESGMIGSFCGRPVLISVAYNSNDKELQFGYEVYYDTKFEKIESSVYSAMQTMKQYISFFSTAKSIFQKLTSDNLALVDNDQTIKLEFVWLKRLSLQHNIKSWTPTIIRYKMLRNFPSILQECDDYNLAKDYFEPFDFDSVYTKENEQKIFEDVDTSSLQSTNGNFKCDPEHEQCLTKWQLIPANQISYDPSESAPSTCSNLTTVPVWVNLTRKYLENLTIFLQAMIRRLKDNLDISILIDDPLLLPRTNDKSPQPIYIHGKESKIPLPSKIHYLIRYQSLYCEKRNPNCNLAILIVVDNNPKTKRNDSICPQEEDICTRLGWNWIRDEDLDPEDSLNQANLYCCEPDESLLSKFKQSRDEIFEFSLFDLYKFPIYDKAGGSSLKDLRCRVLHEIQSIREGNYETGSPGDLSPRSPRSPMCRNSYFGRPQFEESGGSPRKATNRDFARDVGTEIQKEKSLKDVITS